jgi:hypothetical protein
MGACFLTHSYSTSFPPKTQIGIACRLMNPSDTMMLLYGPIVVEGVLVATFFFTGIVGCCLVPIGVVLLAREFCTINVVELD